MEFYLIYLSVKTARWLEEGGGKPVLGVLPDIPVSEDSWSNFASCSMFQLIMVFKTPGLDPDWMMAERGSQRGKVPVTYLEVLE